MLSRLKKEYYCPAWTLAEPSAFIRPGKPAVVGRQIRIIPAHTLKRSEIRVAAYCRVSTDMEEQELSLRNQQEHYTSVIASNPEWTLAGIYADQGFSGTSASRPAFQRLLGDCRAGRVSMILTKSISRFARNAKDLLATIRMLSDLSISVIFEKEHIDTGAMETEFLLTLLAAFAESESRSISGNVKWSIRKRFRDGSFVLSKPPYGYAKHSPSDSGAEEVEYVLLSDQAAVVRQIYAMALGGEGCYNIANHLNSRNLASPGGGTWAANTVRLILRNPFYKGDLLLQKTYTDENFRQRPNRGEEDQYLVESHHVPLVTGQEFERVQALLSLHHTNPLPTFTVFSGLLFCGVCGAPMNLDGDDRYRCKSSRNCRILIHGRDLRHSFVTLLNKLTYSQSLSRADRRLLGIYAKDHPENESAKELRHTITARPIADRVGDSDEKILKKYISRITIYSCHMRFLFTCGLELDEERG